MLEAWCEVNFAITAACMLGLLSFGREVLQPVVTAMAGAGLQSGQESRRRATVAMVAETLDAGQAPSRARRRSFSMLDQNVGAHLRHSAKNS
ncbi:hypothetical protein [Pseudoduganella sp. HUAS MS19]